MYSVYYISDYGTKFYLRIVDSILYEWNADAEKRTKFDSYTKATYWIEHVARVERNLGIEMEDESCGNG